MVDGQFFVLKFDVAVLAGVVVADVNVFATEAYTVDTLGFDVGLELQNARQFKCVGHRPCERRMIFEDFNFFLEPHDECFLP